MRAQSKKASPELTLFGQESRAILAEIQAPFRQQGDQIETEL
jgi:hypothetical protein